MLKSENNKIFVLLLLFKHYSCDIFLSDYFRVLFAFAAFYYMLIDPWMASILYIISGLLDHIDGPVARMLNQGR